MRRVQWNEQLDTNFWTAAGYRITQEEADGLGEFGAVQSSYVADGSDENKRALMARLGGMRLESMKNNDSGQIARRSAGVARYRPKRTERLQSL
jgi:hypothetical protein